MDRAFWRGRRVLITGHTGFKGSWLAVLLGELGAEVCGLALAPRTPSPIFDSLPGDLLTFSTFADVRDSRAVRDFVHLCRPEIVFHFAAQSLVVDGYADPQYTWETNLNGTMNVLDSLLYTSPPATLVVATTDKVYRPPCPPQGYRESDPLGGEDPYSASKSAVELLLASWRLSMSEHGAGRGIVAARAGNVLGGGDWSANRVLPDYFRARLRGEPMAVRMLAAVRPWQHVLDPLVGYLALAGAVFHEPPAGPTHRAMNFGPRKEGQVSVSQVIDWADEFWGGSPVERLISPPPDGRESSNLQLDCGLAEETLGWRCQLSGREAIRWTVEWHRMVSNGTGAYQATLRQVREFIEAL